MALLAFVDDISFKSLTRDRARGSLVRLRRSEGVVLELP